MAIPTISGTLCLARSTCSASGSAVVLLVELPFGGIILGIGRGVRGTIKRFGHFKSVVGGDKSWGQTHFDVLSVKLRQAASFPQIWGRSLHPVITAFPLIGSITSDCCVDSVVADSSARISAEERPLLLGILRRSIAGEGTKMAGNHPCFSKENSRFALIKLPLLR